MRILESMKYGPSLLLVLPIYLLGCGSEPAALDKVEPASVVAGRSVTVSGLDLGSSPDLGTMVMWSLDDDTRFELNSYVSQWSDTSLTLQVPADFLGATLDKRDFVLFHESEGGLSNGLSLQVVLRPDPWIEEVSPPVAEAGDEVRIRGRDFGEDRGAIAFNIPGTIEIKSWHDDEVAFVVPAELAGFSLDDVVSLHIEAVDGLLSPTAPFAVADPNRPTLGLIQRTIFTPICEGGPCHGPTRAGGLSLRSADAYKSLVSAAATQVEGLRVVPYDPDSSLLINKLESATPLVGARMPLRGPYLSQEQLVLIRTWVALGAADD